MSQSQATSVGIGQDEDEHSLRYQQGQQAKIHRELESDCPFMQASGRRRVQETALRKIGGHSQTALLLTASHRKGASFGGM